MNEALIILGDQLFPTKFYEPHLKKHVFMAEDVGLCTHYKYHKHKLAFFLTAMREYAEELKTKGHRVHYESLSNTSYEKRLEKFLKQEKIEKITIGEVQDKFFEKSLFGLFEKLELPFEVLETPMFLCSRQEFKNYLFYHPRPFMKSFYEKERRRLEVLIEKNKKPKGGKWSYDVENRKKVPKELTNKDLPLHKKSEHFSEVRKIVEDKFPDHPGDLENFWLPTNRRSALQSLKLFMTHHLNDFGTYQDSITDRSPYLYHSVLSPMLNMGLLTPQEVIEAALKTEAPLHSVEGFIRQIMGWREFVRGVYQNYSEEEETKNFFKHKRKMTDSWYKGTTGLPPVDDAIKKANELGYCHHIERLMILSNVMLLTELHPHEVHKWFMEMFVDSADWVMGPNVYGMGQFSDGGIFATKPYISGSNYILKMSDYKKGDWCDVWDGLFWRFIDKHESYFSKNPRLNMMVNSLHKMEPTRKKTLLKLANEFIKNNTLESH
ncbi:cryptochrome/photolyase family protein [Peredibacter starrii]|uniref:Cryptochrome/photolyase family protein n=1 Tax=Peredibacter starrii TaxID=28202 RepID=A0AAX4HLY1_9BACT|nr:cryptochrome/photolyase family protein [Peredibacter starrii]WPU64273.1 cryptochrome/photolyase family protein [Peredibacter starrii]